MEVQMKATGKMLDIAIQGVHEFLNKRSVPADQINLEALVHLLAKEVAAALPQGALRAAAIKGGLELRKHLSSPEKNIKNIFKEAKRVYSPKNYAIDEFLQSVPERVRGLFADKTVRDYILAEQGKAKAVEAELVEPQAQRQIPFMRLHLSSAALMY